MVNFGKILKDKGNDNVYLITSPSTADMNDEEQLGEQDAVIIVRQQPVEPPEKSEEPEGESPKEEEIKCPICGNLNPPGTDKCKICWTNLSVDAETSELTVSSPKEQGEIFHMIDLEDPMTRKRLEELTMIPGVSKRKALYLYRSGITSLEEFVEKAFHGDRRGENFSRMVANKIIVGSMAGGGKEEAKIICTHCDSKTDAGLDNCQVCGKSLETIDMEEVSETLGIVANSYLEELSENEDFAALPEDMRIQMAAALESDSETTEDIHAAVESLGDEFEELDIISEDETQDPISADGSDEGEETEQKPAEKKKLSPDKKRAVLVKKIKDWYDAGYDVSGLYELVDGDLESFKTAAKVMIKKGKNK